MKLWILTFQEVSIFIYVSVTSNGRYQGGMLAPITDHSYSRLLAPGLLLRSKNFLRCVCLNKLDNYNNYNTKNKKKIITFSVCDHSGDSSRTTSRPGSSTSSGAAAWKILIWSKNGPICSTVSDATRALDVRFAAAKVTSKSSLRVFLRPSAYACEIVPRRVARDSCLPTNPPP